jgi:hypothetical protein
VCRHHVAILHRLGQEPGILWAFFFKAQNKTQDPAKLSRLVQLIDAKNWISLDADTKGDLYEGLLQSNAEDTKSGAGQYFTQGRSYKPWWPIFAHNPPMAGWNGRGRGGHGQLPYSLCLPKIAFVIPSCRSSCACWRGGYKPIWTAIDWCGY